MMGLILLWLIMLLWSTMVSLILLLPGKTVPNTENPELVCTTPGQCAKICKHRIFCKLPRIRHMI